MEIIKSIILYFVIPFGIAVLSYLLLHLQMILLNKVLGLKIHRNMRTKISLAAFLGAFIGVLGLSILRGVYNG